MLTYTAQPAAMFDSAIQTPLPNETDANSTLSPAPQLVFLDFDGAVTSYRNRDLDIAIDHVVVEDSGFGAPTISAIVADLNALFADAGASFTAELPAAGSYSTVYIGVTSAFEGLGEFYGLAETVDSGNRIADDNAFVLLNSQASAALVTSVIAHEAGHLLGTLDHGGEGLDAYAAATVIPKTSTTNLYNGQLLSGVSVLGTLNVQSGGAAFNVLVLNGGTVEVTSWGTIGTNTYLENPGKGAEVRNGGELKLNHGLAYDINVVAGGALTLTGQQAKAVGVRVRGLNASISVEANARVSSVEVSSGGKVTVEDGGTISGALVYSGAKLIINDGGAGMEIQELGGYVSVTEATGGNAGGQATSGGTVDDDGTGGTAGTGAGTSTGGTTGGAQVTFVPSRLPSLVLMNNSASLHSVTVVDSADIKAGGQLDVFRGGVASTVNLGGVASNAATANISNGGLVSSVFVASNGVLNISSGGTALEVLETGGYVDVQSGASVDFLSNVISTRLTLTRYNSASLHSNTSATGGVLMSGYANKLLLDGSYLTQVRTSNTYSSYYGNQVEVINGATLDFISLKGNSYYYTPYAEGIGASWFREADKLSIRDGGRVSSATINNAVFVNVAQGFLGTLYGSGDSNVLTISSGGFVNFANLEGYHNHVLILSGGRVNQLTMDIDDYYGNYYGGFVVSSGGTVNQVNLSHGSAVVNGGTVNSGVLTDLRRLTITGNAQVTGVQIANVSSSVEVTDSFLTAVTMTGLTANVAGSYLTDVSVVDAVVNLDASTSSGGNNQSAVVNPSILENFTLSSGGTLGLANATTLNGTVRVLNGGKLLMDEDKTIQVAVENEQGTIGLELGADYSGGLGLYRNYTGLKTIQVVDSSHYAGDYVLLGFQLDNETFFNNIDCKVTVASAWNDKTFRTLTGTSPVATIDGVTYTLSEKEFYWHDEDKETHRSLVLTVSGKAGQPDTPQQATGFTITASTTRPTVSPVTLTVTYEAENWQETFTELQYSLDGEKYSRLDNLDISKPEKLTGTCTVTKNGTVHFRAIAYNGSVDNSTTYTVSNIGTDPNPDDPDQPTNGIRVTADITEPTKSPVTLTAVFDEASVAQQYRNGSGAWQDYTGPVEVTENTSVYFRQKFEDGSWSKPVRYLVSNINASLPDGPTVTADITEPTSGTVTLTADFGEDAAARQYRIGNGDWQDYEAPVEVAENATVYFRRQNADGSWATGYYQVDNIDHAAPTIKLTGDTESILKQATLAADTEPGVDIYYSLDEATWTKYDGEIAVTANATYFFKATDVAGNTGTASITFDKIDTTAPDAVADLAATVVEKHIGFAWTEPADDLAGVAGYDIEVADTDDFSHLLGSESGLAKTSFSIEGTDSGTIYCRVRAIDAVGNASDWAVTSVAFTMPSQPTVVEVPATDVPEVIEGTETDELFNLAPAGHWGTFHVARWNGDPKDTVKLAGFNRFSNSLDGIGGYDLLQLPDGDNALLYSDVLSPKADGTDGTGRILNIAEITGAQDGRNVIDLTAADGGYAGDVLLKGGNAEDHLWAGAGNDILAGGKGDDDLRGGAGDDIYLFGENWGKDSILDDGGKLVFDNALQDKLTFSDGAEGTQITDGVNSLSLNWKVTAAEIAYADVDGLLKLRRDTIKGFLA